MDVKDIKMSSYNQVGTHLIKRIQKLEPMKNKSKFRNTISWIFALVLLTVGVLNLILVHPVPGLVYILLALICLPQTNALLKKWFDFTIPFAVKIVLFLLFMWYSLAVGEVWGNL